MADTKKDKKENHTFVLLHEPAKDKRTTYMDFLNKQIGEFRTQLVFSKSTRWVRVDRRWKHVAHDDLPVGLKKIQVRTERAIVIGIKDSSVDLSKVSCLKKTDIANEYTLVNAKGEVVVYEKQPVIVQTRLLSKPAVKSLSAPKKAVAQRENVKSAKKAVKWWVSESTFRDEKVKINVSSKDIKPLTFAKQLGKILRDNHRGFATSKEVRSVRVSFDKETKRHLIVMTLTRASADLSSLKNLMSLDKTMINKSRKSKTDLLVSEYFYLDTHGRKVQFGKRFVKIQTRVHNLTVASLRQPKNKVAQRHPAKKHATKWYISVKSSKTGQKKGAFRSLIQTYSKQICTSKLIHWIRIGARWENSTEEELKKVKAEEKKNNVVIVVGVRNSKVRLSDVSCLQLDESISSSTEAFVHEYFLIDSNKNKIQIDGQQVKVQTRSLKSLLKRKEKSKGTEFFVSTDKKTDTKEVEKKESRKESLNTVVQDFYKQLVTSRDIHYIKVDKRWGEARELCEDDKKNTLAIIMALSNKNVDLSTHKNLALDAQVKPSAKDDFVNEYFLTNDGGKRIECQGYPIKVQTRVQKIAVSALGEPQIPVRQLKTDTKKRTPEVTTARTGQGVQV